MCDHVNPVKGELLPGFGDAVQRKGKNDSGPWCENAAWEHQSPKQTPIGRLAFPGPDLVCQSSFPAAQLHNLVPIRISSASPAPHLPPQRFTIHVPASRPSFPAAQLHNLSPDCPEP